MNLKQTIKILVVVGALGAGAYYGVRAYQKHTAETGDIRSYATAEDEAFIRKEFKDNWYTLVAMPNMDLTFILTTKSPNNREPQYFGKMDIKMLYHEGHPIGFITYYMQTAYQGDIQFLVIGKDFRGKRYAEKLLNYAFDDFRKRGAKTVKIFTRTENLSAQKIYKRVGFVESGRMPKEMQPREGGIFYRKEL